MYSSLLGSTFPLPPPLISMGQNVYTFLYLKDSSAQLYNPIFRFSPGLGKTTHLDVDHHISQIADRTLLD